MNMNHDSVKGWEARFGTGSFEHMDDYCEVQTVS